MPAPVNRYRSEYSIPSGNAVNSVNYHFNVVKNVAVHDEIETSEVMNYYC